MSFLDMLEGKGVEIRPNSSDPEEFNICCPFCSEMGHTPDYKFRFGFNIKKGLGHCFNCGYVTRKAAIDLVRIFGGTDADIAAVREIKFTKQTTKRPEKVELPKGYELLLDIDVDDEEYGAAKKYAIERGITVKQMKEKEIGVTIADFKFSYRLCFPVRLVEGKLAGVVGRDWTGKAGPRYMNTADMKALYNARPDLYCRDLAIGAEGIIKALAIERATRYKLCSFAFLGHHTTDEKTAQLAGFKEIVLFPDVDDAGVRGTINIAANLASLFKVSIAWPWPDKQADELSPETIRRLIRGRKPYSTFLEWDIKKQFKGILV